MDIQRRQVIEFLGHAAFVLSLLFVALEIRQANRIAVGTTTYEIQRNYMALNELMMSDGTVPALMVKLRQQGSSGELSAEESIRAGALARRFMNMWIAIQVAYNNGLVEEAIYAGGVSDVSSVVDGLPGLVPFVLQELSDRDHLPNYQILKPLVAGERSQD